MPNMEIENYAKFINFLLVQLLLNIQRFKNPLSKNEFKPQMLFCDRFVDWFHALDAQRIDKIIRLIYEYHNSILPLR